ncbi:MAG: diaminopimelate epimerase [Gammaproteobacteria bacterium]|nr:diaminopimelate epimerase [Gammaproteobacteria bacterium]
MRVEFSKMHGLGNDFVVIDACSGQPVPDPDAVRRIADRHFGVGCDQVLVIEAPPVADADIGYRIFNADGGEAGQCGNGIRCVARYLADRGRVRGDRLVAVTRDRRLQAWLLDDGGVRVDMGVPRLAPADIPLLAKEQATRYEIDLPGQRCLVGALSMGNPHAVLVVDDSDRAPVASLGSAIGRHPSFPQGANVGFMQVLGPSHVRLRVFERGAGETLACGTGACAAVVTGRLQALLEAVVDVDLAGGRLRVEWQGGDAPVWLSGPASYVFEGVIDL